MNTVLKRWKWVGPQYFTESGRRQSSRLCPPPTHPISPAVNAEPQGVGGLRRILSHRTKNKRLLRIGVHAVVGRSFVEGMIRRRERECLPRLPALGMIDSHRHV